MSVQGPTAGGNRSTLVDLVESLGTVFIQREQIKRGLPLTFGQGANDSSQFKKVDTGVDSDGSTIRAEGQFVPGVSNTNLLLGAGVLALVITLAVVVK